TPLLRASLATHASAPCSSTLSLHDALPIYAAVVSLSLAALYQPVWTSAIHAPKDFGLALGALIALMYLKLPPWLVVVGGGAVGRSEEHTSELQSRFDLVCRLLLEKKKTTRT